METPGAEGAVALEKLAEEEVIITPQLENIQPLQSIATNCVQPKDGLEQFLQDRPPPPEDQKKYTPDGIFGTKQYYYDSKLKTWVEY